MDDLYWLQLVNYNFIQDVISFFRNFFDQDKLQEHIKKYQEKTDNETWKFSGLTYHRMTLTNI